MIDSTRRRVRVLVCGTGFGRIHLRAIAADDDVDLAGILSRGSAASRGVAAEYGVTCHTSVDDLPDDIDIACVVIPSKARRSHCDSSIAESTSSRRARCCPMRSRVRCGSRALATCATA